MKTIGLIGGMSWESTVTYYQIINRRVQERLGGLHSARCLLYSFDFHDIETLQHQGEWEEATRLMCLAAQTLQRAGADLLVICTNTMHKMAEPVQHSVGIPLVHIADTTARRIHDARLTRVGLLATRFTMEEPFYTGRLRDKHNLDVRVPSEKDRQAVHDIIYNELCRGKIDEASRTRYRAVIQSLVDDGAQAVILGCTEIGLLVYESDSPVPLFDTARIHAEEAADVALR